MEELLKPVKTVKKVRSNIEKFETLSLKENQPFYSKGLKQNQRFAAINEITDHKAESSLKEVNSSIAVKREQLGPHSENKQHKKRDSTPFLQQSYLGNSALQSLPDDAQEILKSQPDSQDLAAVLQYLQYGIEAKHNFNIRKSSPQSALIINVLVTTTIPDQWSTLKSPGSKKENVRVRDSLLSCMTSVGGLGALLAQIKRLSVISTAEKPSGLLLDEISTLSRLLAPPDILSTFLKDTKALYEKVAQRNAIWQELTSIIAGSKILATVAQAQSKLSKMENDSVDGSWLGDGAKYSSWLARRVSHTAAVLNVTDSELWVMLTQITRRGLNLGHRDSFVSEIYSGLLMGRKALWTSLRLILQNLSRTEQISFFNSILRDLTKKYLVASTVASGIAGNGIEDQRSIEGVAAIVQGVVDGNNHLEDYLIEWLTATNGEHAILGLDTRRAVIATLALHEEKLQRLLNKCLEEFGDKVNIQYAAILQQDAMAQTILLVAGYLNRLKSKFIKDLSRSSSYLQAVSNRLAASVPRARFLGMIVGMAISKIIDEPEREMRFDVEEMETEEAKRWFGLIHIEDAVGNVKDLCRSGQTSKPINFKISAAKHTSATERKKSQTTSETSKIISIEEILSDSEDEDEDDLAPYAKPDDDPSDSEDDPTLVNRSKPSVPVYIVDLVKYLQVSDKPEVVQLALKTAPTLIRRKANFGTELSENMFELAAALINLQEGMASTEGHSQRLQSLLACVVALPERMGPWISSIYFEGDFSLAQRASLLTTIGLGTRELSGYEDDPNAALEAAEFPTKRLPAHLEALYLPLDAVVKEIEYTTLQPMALKAADKISGPDILKVRTFSSRMDIQKRNAQKAEERKVVIPKNLHQLLTEAFFIPLCDRMNLLLSSHFSTRNSTLFEAHIMKLFLQTLIILMTNLGPHALQLPIVTRETLSLLTTVHSIPSIAMDPVVLPAVLQLFLTTIDLNIEAGPLAKERLVSDFGAPVAELVAWAVNLHETASVSTGGTDEGMPWTVLAAACQVKWYEIGRSFQGRILGFVGTDLDHF